MVVQRLVPVALLVFLSAPPEAARASLIVAPTIGPRDAGLTGNVVAIPEDGPSILLHNAAGVAELDGSEALVSLFLTNVSGRYTNDLTGYDEKSSERPVAPTFWLGTDHLAPWKLGIGLYGAVGSAFNFGADPAAGFPNRFLAETTVIRLGMVAGRELLPGFRVGAQVAPTWGEIRARIPSPFGPVAFDVSGFGVDGTVGMLWDVAREITLGASYRSPGIVFMDGDGRVGEAPERVEIDFRTPQLVTFGIGWKPVERLVVDVQARWSDYPEFEKGVFEFQNRPELDRPFISDARSTFRYGAGVEYALAPWARVRAGVSREEWMMEGSSLGPFLYDASDFIYGVGAGFDVERWTIDFVIGDSLVEDRVVTPEENPLFPGRYQLEGGVAGIGVTWRFGGGSLSP